MTFWITCHLPVVAFKEITTYSYLKLHYFSILIACHFNFSKCAISYEVILKRAQTIEYAMRREKLG